MSQKKIDISIKNAGCKKGEFDMSALDFLQSKVMTFEEAKKICSKPISECRTEESQKIWVTAFYFIVRFFILKKFPNLKARDLNKIKIIIENGGEFIRGFVKKRREKQFEFQMPYTMEKFEFMNEKDLSVDNINEQ